jgi:beta-lactamase superfamily II metal-dependent hydrolase
MEIYFYQAGCGDAARISFNGNDGRMHHVFIDGGYERTFSHVLKDAIVEAGTIDLWVVSHIHDDHIGGVEAYISALERKEINVPVKAWLYNPPRKSLSQHIENSAISSARGIRQGDLLWQFIVNGKLQPVSDTIASAVCKDVFGLKMFVLSPGAEKLKKLRKKYAEPALPLEKEEGMEISVAKTARGDDYAIKLMDFDLENWEEDGNVDNGSSISLLTDLNGFKILWLADAHPKDIVAGLENLGYTPQRPLSCDWVKVTHHGSKGNNSDDLYDRIRCSNYLFSVDGENLHYLPNKEAIARILRNKSRNIFNQPYSFYFTYDNPTLRRIFAVDGDRVFTTLNFQVRYSRAKWITLPINASTNSLS